MPERTSPARGVVELTRTHKICGAASGGSMRIVGVATGEGEGEAVASCGPGNGEAGGGGGLGMVDCTGCAVARAAKPVASTTLKPSPTTAKNVTHAIPIATRTGRTFRKAPRRCLARSEENIDRHFRRSLTCARCGAAAPKNYALRVTRFERRHCVQTFAVRCVPRSSTFTDCRLGSQRRRVLFMAWLTLLPARGPLPQTSQRFAIGVPLHMSWLGQTSQLAAIGDPDGDNPRIVP